MLSLWGTFHIYNVTLNGLPLDITVLANYIYEVSRERNSEYLGTARGFSFQKEETEACRL